MARVLKQSDTSVYVQPRLGATKYFLGDCVDIDSLPNPRGDITLIQCWNRARSGHETVGLKRGAPGIGSFTVSELKKSAASWLESILESDCPPYIYVAQRECGDAGVQDNWVRMVILGPCYPSDDTLTNVANRTGDEESGHDYVFSFPPPRIDVRWPTAARKDTTETQAANSVAALTSVYCGDDCSVQITPGDRIVVAPDSTGAATANFLYSNNGGTTITAAAADPFTGVAENVLAATYFEYGAAVFRWLVARSTTVGSPAQVSYSDDSGATWTRVTVGATNGECATGPKSLFALDREHIWFCTTSGNVFFSADGGATWTDQDANTASGANSLAAINFVDEQIGYAVGAADTVIRTRDGGATWTAATATGSAVALSAVKVFSYYHVLVGTAIVATGSLRVTFDGTASWSVVSFTGYATERVADLHFINHAVGMMVTDTAGPVGSVHMTVDGGATWREITVPANSGLNSVWMTTPNEAYFVGEANGGTAFIGKISG